MAIREYNGVLSYKDKTGDTHLLYPVTKKDCVDGLEEMDAAIQAARETQRQLDAHAANRANPHGVTAEQIPCATGGTVASALQAAASHRHTTADISNFPGALPASDVYPWAKAAAKPSYAWEEIDNRPAALPASGGNADTVGGYDINGIINSAVSLGCRIVTGSYVGDGTASKTVTFGVAAKIVVISAPNPKLGSTGSSGDSDMMVFVRGISSFSIGGEINKDYGAGASVSWSSTGLTMTSYGGSSAYAYLEILNIAGTTYYWAALI